MITPHGGELVNRLVTGPRREEELEAARFLPAITLNSRETSDLEMIAVGAMSPLGGFMSRADYQGVVDSMRLRDGTLFPLPVVLATKPGDDPAKFPAGGDAALKSGDGRILGVLRGLEMWEID
ncbi:MAG: sulfate adenylyltransferase, partial [Planctomycetota bacterium]